MIARFFANQRGATAIEYAMIAAFLSIAIVAAAGAIGGNLLDIFNAVGAGFH